MNEETVVVTDGVTVTKSFDAEEFPVPAVTFAVESTRTEPVELTITDTIPEDFGIEQIGFHPEYGSEDWTATGNGEVRFERTVESDASFTTLYGIRMAADTEPTRFLEKPTVEVNAGTPADGSEPEPEAEAEMEADGVVPAESSELVRELARGDRESVPGLAEETTGDEPGEKSGDEPGTEPVEAEEAARRTVAGLIEETVAESEAAPAEMWAEADETESEADSDETDPETTAGETDPETDTAAQTDDVEPTAETADEPTETSAPDEGLEATVPEEPTQPAADADAEPVEADAAADQPTDPTPETPMEPETETESIATALAEEIEAGTVDQDALATIREAVRTESPSDRVRIEHLQTRLSDLEAYSDALEEFIDDNGGAQQVLSDLEAEINSLGADLAHVEERLDVAETDRDTMNEHLENLTDTVEAIAGVAEQIERLRGDLEALDERVDEVESTQLELESLSEQVDALEAELEAVQEWRDQLSDVFG
ncbi:hypothetical protein RH831_06670 [Halodesulfurarchaeum sp. HSR-GB]|uniref:hypothetical protein n=1 Tax=Halodesulfurarchaeum sp. HSR-GB TaxID=3074077 RepID=UPI00285F07F3|nr:hypothetical protein [Halodesulfurarchaeum sp. HSR-GB]MDR5656861.1 hypothetical protein [Halodesulfurarchaeum sp. HSR-GB]